MHEKLPSRLLSALERIADPIFRDRMRHVYFGAASAIVRLSDMDLLKYDVSETDASADLSLWEELAPVMRDTVVEVNALLQIIRTHFPHPPSANPPPDAVADDLRKHAAQHVLHASAATMSQDVARLGEAIRNPSIVSDRWNLLSELQSFRSRFRDQIGNLVYETASNFDEIGRADVVPDYEDEVRAALAIRSEVADLALAVADRLEQVREGPPEDLQWVAQQLRKDADAFGATDAYRALRAQDKRTMIEFRQALGRMGSQPALLKAQLPPLAERFAQFVGSLNRLNFKDVLVAHDREAWAECGVKIEHAEQLAITDSVAAGTMLLEAVARGQSLYGRDGGLDAFLRKMLTVTAEELTGQALANTAEEFRGVLARVADL